jgi:hypothetical protein
MSKPILQQVKELIPPLNGHLHKGQAGASVERVNLYNFDPTFIRFGHAQDVLVSLEEAESKPDSLVFMDQNTQ